MSCELPLEPASVFDDNGIADHHACVVDVADGNTISDPIDTLSGPISQGVNESTLKGIK